MTSEIGDEANKAPRTLSTLEAQLDRQLGYLQRSCSMFDAGLEDEGQRIAVTLRTLLHDTRKSVSLLMQMSIKDSLQFVDTGLYRDQLDRSLRDWVAREQPGNIISGFTPGEAGLVVAGLNTAGLPAWVAPLATPHLPPKHPAAATVGIKKPFKPWWTSPLVETSALRYFSRKNLVLIMANQDGGAHIDPKLDKDYEALTVDFLGHSMEIGSNLTDKTMGGDIPPMRGNVAAASVRQIAFEVLSTIRPDGDHSAPVRRLPAFHPILIGRNETEMASSTPDAGGQS